MTSKCRRSLLSLDFDEGSGKSDESMKDDEGLSVRLTIDEQMSSLVGKVDDRRANDQIGKEGKSVSIMVCHRRP